MATPPNFINAGLEFRFENGIVCIYGTPEGLKAVSEACIKLIKNPKQSHIHFDKNLSSVKLTDNSIEAAIAIF